MTQHILLDDIFGSTEMRHEATLPPGAAPVPAVARRCNLLPTLNLHETFETFEMEALH